MAKARTKKAGNTLNITMRPRNLDEVLGLDDQKAALKNVLTSGTIPRAFCIHGPFGCGKTTLARIIATEIQPSADGFQVQEINSADLSGIDGMRSLIRESQTAPLSGGYNVIILDEAHKLTKPAQEALLKAFEEENTPTVWIICTSDKDKLIEGLRAGRCFTLIVRGLDDPGQRAALIAKAGVAVGFTGPLDPYLDALTRANVTSPRKMLMGFEAYVAGVNPEDAVGSLQFVAMPEYWEIAMGTVFGKWAAPYSLPWISPKPYPPVCEQLKSLDTKLKKKPTNANDDAAEDEDVQGRSDVAQALMAITCATLKGQIIRASKGFSPARAQAAADSLRILAFCMGQHSYGMEFAQVVGGLYNVNVRMNQK